MASGFFFETQFSPYFHFDPANLKATIKGNADHPFVATSLIDVGKWTAEALLRPESKNATVNLPGEKHSYNEIIKIFEDAKGKKISVTHISKEQLQSEIEAFGENVWGAFVDLLLRAISDGKGTTWDDKNFPGLSSRTVSLADFAKTV